MHTSEMLNADPTQSTLPHNLLVYCIEACFDCAQSCSACASACLGEPQIDKLRRCIRLNEDCADACLATGRMLSRQQYSEPRLIRAQLELCRLACQLCGDECARHANQHDHCRICAEACRACLRACQDVIGKADASSVATA